MNLFKHQEKALEITKDHNRVAYYLDMGLGKTIQVISLILKLKEDKKIKGQILIVCPTTLVGNWAKEFDTFAKSIKTLIYHGADRAFDNSADVIITTFAILRIDLEEFKKKKRGSSKMKPLW